MISIFIALLLLATLYVYSTRNFNYWKKKGVKHDKPIPIFGNNAPVYFMQKSPTQLYSEIYKKYPGEKAMGFFRSNYPELLVRDPEIIKRILVSDFNHFYLRVVLPTDEKEPLADNLFNMNGDQWRLLRQRLTPAFTSGKLKAMFPLIVERAERLHTRIQAAAGAPIDARDLMARFTTDFIGACGFGLDMDALSEEESEFRKLGKSLFNISVKDAIKIFLKQISPKIFKSIKRTGELEKKVFPLVKSILMQRNYKPSGRHDFVDLLLECKEKGTMVGNSIDRFHPDGNPEKATLEMTDNLIAAQMFVFFAAGFETSSSTTSFTLHLLAYNPEKQKKVQEEIDRVLCQFNNTLCYDAVKDMHYLEWAFKESMRMYPSVGFLIRDCSRKYTFQDLGFTIDEGIRVIIPNMALQNDPEYFESPEEFRPERFSPDELDVGKTRFVYLPFGEGPRACIGERLGLMQSLAGLAAVLSKFTVEPAPTSQLRPVFESKPVIVQAIKGGLPLVFRERKRM